MALTIDATVGGAATNSFVTVAEMTAYCEGRLNATLWTGVDAAQTPALVEATRELTTLTWVGTRVTATQAQAWPRRYALNPDAPFGVTWWYDTTSVPQRVKDAACELALQFLKAGTTDIAALPANDGVIEKAVDVLKTRWAHPGNQKRGLARYPSVYRYIRPLLTSSGVMISLVKG